MTAIPEPTLFLSWEHLYSGDFLPLCAAWFFSLLYLINFTSKKKLGLGRRLMGIRAFQFPGGSVILGIASLATVPESSTKPHSTWLWIPVAPSTSWRSLIRLWTSLGFRFLSARTQWAGYTAYLSVSDLAQGKCSISISSCYYHYCSYFFIRYKDSQPLAECTEELSGEWKKEHLVLHLLTYTICELLLLVWFPI